MYEELNLYCNEKLDIYELQCAMIMTPAPLTEIFNEKGECKYCHENIGKKGYCFECSMKEEFFGWQESESMISYNVFA